MTRVQLFDPPMCCPTGVCGPNVDPVLLDIQETLSRISREYQGKIEVTRHLFGKDLQAFVSAPQVMAEVGSRGRAALPILAIDGRIVKSGAYPKYEEIVAQLREIVSGE